MWFNKRVPLSLYVALGVFLRLWNHEFREFFLLGFYRFSIRFSIRFVHFTCVFCAIHVRSVREMWFRWLLAL